MNMLNSHEWLSYWTTQLQNIFINSEETTELDLGFKPHGKIHNAVFSLNVPALIHYSGIFQRGRVYILLIMMNRVTFQS